MAKIKVLMVDDEVQFRETTAKVLKRRGYETRVAAGGDEALGILETDRFDVVVLDVKMPGMDGNEALGRIKAPDPRVQVIMLTGHGGEASALDSLNKEAFDYLAKPCDIDRLTARINDAYTVAQCGGKPREKKACEVMIPVEDYTTIGPEQTVAEGIEALRKSFQDLMTTSKLMQTGHRSILVIDRQKEIVGILGIMELMEGLRPPYLSAPKPSTASMFEYSTLFWTGLFTAQARILAGKKVRDIMGPPPPEVDDDANLMEISDLLYKEDCRRLVVKRAGEAIGVIREQEVFFELANIIPGR